MGIDERKGKGKEYNSYNDKLIFEGEYLNGKKFTGKGYDKNGNMIYEIKNGKGNIKTYYDNGKLKVEREHLNGEKNGKFKEYYDNGILRFEGEYLNGKLNGKFKGYYDNGKLRFEGEFLNGKPLGKFKVYYNNGI